jgi:hypothetical protein
MTSEQLGHIILRCAKMLVSLLEKQLKPEKQTT